MRRCLVEYPLQHGEYTPKQQGIPKLYSTDQRVAVIRLAFAILGHGRNFLAAKGTWLASAKCTLIREEPRLL